MHAYLYFCSFFSDELIGEDLNIIEIPDIDFQICQSLKGSILFGYIFYEMFQHNQTNSWISHEVCHQWWGHSLFFQSSCENYRFLEESVTEYLKGYYVKTTYGITAYDSLYSQYEYNYNYITLEEDIPINKIQTINSMSSGIIIYSKGALLLKKICDEFQLFDFKTTVNDFYQRFVGQKVCYQDFEAFIRDDTIKRVLNEQLNSVGF
jgi:aminopeptidase N